MTSWNVRTVRSVLGMLCLALPLTTSTAGSDAPVADAAQQGDVAQVRELLRKGADVNAPQGDGMTALHWAAEENDTLLANVVLYAGADVSAGTRIGHYTPLHVAAQEGNAAVARVLLRAGADPNARTTNSGSTPLHLAAGSGNPELVQALLDHGAEVDAREASWNQTPLMFAAANNRAAAVKVLLAAGADPSATAKVVDVVQMAEADNAANKRLESLIAQFKEQEGGGPDWEPSPDQVQAAIEASWTIQRKWPNVPTDDELKADGKKATARPADSEGEATATAKGGKKDDKVVSAPKADAKAGKKKGEDDEADDAAAPKPKQYQDLVGHWGGLTPLLHAVRQGSEEAALALLDGGADINQVSAGDHTSPLLMAAINGQWDLGMKLIQRGADPNLASDAGATPLYAVLEREWAPKSSYAHPEEQRKQNTTYLQIMKSLLEHGANPNVRLKEHLWYMEYTFGVLLGSGINLQGATPFWRAAYALDVDAMRLLKEHGADPNIPTTKPAARRFRRGGGGGGEDEDHSGVPEVPVNGPNLYPIHAATGAGYGISFAGNAHRHVPDGWLAAVKFLVEECGADVNARDAEAFTPLHDAAARGDNEVIRYLVEHGADVTAVNRKGQTTVDMANGAVQRVQPFPETIALLESLGAKNNHNCVSCD